jgi:pimeloyl-ACP methyl ester carboxylesterase
MSKALAILFVIFFASFGFSQTKELPAGFKECEITGVNGRSFCGSIDVLEDHQNAQGRKISINVIVVSSLIRPPSADPIFFLAGGPGEAATNEVDFESNGLPGLRQHHDLVFVDQRGTGKSNPLQCDFFGDDPQSYLGSLFPIEKVRQCREQLKGKADLTRYTTMDFVQDLEDVRQALGYNQINLIAGSYGTKVAFIYMRMYPKAIRSAVLSGVAPPTQRAPLSYAKDAQRSLEALFHQCKTDESCNKNFPDPQKDLQSILNRFDKQGSIKTSIKISEDQKKTVELTRSVFAERLRFMLYNNESRSKVPLILHQAALGNFEPFTEIAYEFSHGVFPGINFPLLLSVTCLEEVQFIYSDEAKREAAGSFYGLGRYNDHSAACAEWPHREISKEITTAVKFDGPVLMVTGSLDPVTPPHWSYDALKTLPHGRVIELAGETHYSGPCVATLATTFIEKGSSADLDKLCEQKRPSTPFTINLQ